MPTTIIGPKYRKRQPNIPFYKKGQYLVRLEITPQINNNDDMAARQDEILNVATNRFIMHYYPELYPGIEGAMATVSPGYEDIYNRLREEIKTSINIKGFYKPTAPPFAGRSFVIAQYVPAKKSVDTIRSQLKKSTYYPAEQSSGYNANGEEILLGLPPMEPVVEYFNSIQPNGGIVGENSESTFIIGSMLDDNNLLDNGLKSFTSQLFGFPGGIDFNLPNFNFLQQDVQKFLVLFVATLVSQFDTKKDVTEFSEADTLTIFFGHEGDNPSKPVVSRMEYLVINESIENKTLAVGYLTNVAYNPSFQDPLTISMLRNYEDVLEGIQSSMPGMGNASNYSFSDFLQSLGPSVLSNTASGMNTYSSSLGPGLESQNWEAFDFIKPIVTDATEEIHEGFAKAAADLGLPVDNKQLSDGIEAALTSEQIKKMREKVLENPEVAEKVFAEQKAKVLGAGINVSKNLGRILEQGPLGFVKKNSPLDVVFRQLGVQEIAKEAFRCLTLGTSPQMERINNAVQKALTNQAGSIYLPPPSNKGSVASISKPDIDLEMFKPFSLTGDIWKQILKSVIDGLRNAVLEIMKDLANLLHELCNFDNPFSDDYGAQDLSGFLPQEPANVYGSSDSALALRNLAEQNGLTNDQLFKYLREVSSILSSMEICFLLTDQSQVTIELIQRLIIYNKEYDNPYISMSLITANTVMSFFSDLSQIIDVTDLCDEIANVVYDINQDDICLTEGDITDAIEAQNIDSLLDLMENGLRLDLAPINFECPDKPGFIENPLFSRAIPETLNFTTEIIEMCFINSTSAALNVLLEPSVVNGKNNIGAALLKALPEGAQPQDEAYTDSPAASSGMLTSARDAFNNFSSNLGDLDDCDAMPTGGAIPAVIEALTDIFNDPEFMSAIQGITDSFDNITNVLADADASNSAPRTTYSFPISYLNGFNNFIPAEGPTFNLETQATSLATLEHDHRVVANRFTATSEDTNGIASMDAILWEPPETSSTASSDPYNLGNISVVSMDSIVGSYKNLTLDFSLSTVGKRDHLTISYPSFDTAVEAAAEDTLSFATVTLTSENTTPFLPNNIEFNITSSTLEIIQSHFWGGDDTRLQTNPYVHTFTDPLRVAMMPLLEVMTFDQRAAMKEERETLLFPSMFSGLTKGMFNYIFDNGIFDAASVRKLQFFKDNKDCPPGMAADLLDADGILEQVKQEFLQSACFDDSMAIDIKIRYGVMLSLFFHLIQVEIAEFIIKNIFVFSAFDVSDIMAKPVVAQFMASRVRDDVEKALNHRPEIRTAIQEYYNLKMARPPVASQGGLLDHTNQVVFPVGTSFSSANWPALVEYLVRERLYLSRQPVANVVRMALPNTQYKKSLDAVFVQDILGFVGGQTPHLDEILLSERETSELTDTYSPLNYGRLALERVFAWDAIEVSPNGTIPVALEPTKETGGELELTEFISNFLAHGLAFGQRAIVGRGDLRNSTNYNNFSFVNARVQYRLVYFLPTSQLRPVASSNGVDYSGAPGMAGTENYAARMIQRLSTSANISAVGQDSALEDILNEQETLFMHFIPAGTSEPADAPLQYTVGIAAPTTEGSVTSTIPSFINLIRVRLADIRIESGLTAVLGSDMELLDTALNRFITATPTGQANETAAIVSDPVYKKFFGETFNQELITMVPIYQNFYLTNRYFGKIESVFNSTKSFIIQSFLDVLTGKDPQEAPGNSRPSSAAAIQNSRGPDFAAKFEGLGRDFILKMLIETPIMILKGLAEMIDPHVAIWKVVRNVTGTAFSEIIKVLDAGPLEPLNEVLGPLGPLSGEEVLGIMLCLVELSMQTGLEEGIRNSPTEDAGLPLLANEELVNNILPKFTLDGVDFTGTFSGMLMIPPLPFGILYILLDLLKRDLESALTNENEVSGGNNLPEC